MKQAIRTLVTGFLVVAAGVGKAEMTGDERMELANDLAELLASEEPCRLTFDQKAVASFVETRVPADDLGFAGSVTFFMPGAKREIAEMGASEKTVRCTQAARVAKSYGFID